MKVPRQLTPLFVCAALGAGVALTAQSPPQSPPPAQAPPQPQVFGSQGQQLDPTQQPAPQPQRAGGAGRGGRGAATGETPDFTKQPPIQAKRPEEEIKQIILQPGYRLECVL